MYKYGDWIIFMLKEDNVYELVKCVKCFDVKKLLLLLLLLILSQLLLYID